MDRNGVAIVTGGSRGIGYETAKLLIERGWKVGITARGADTLHEAAERLGPSAVAAPCDVADPQAAAAAVAQVASAFGPVTALVNNAGVITPVGRLHEIDAQDWLRPLRVNIGGAYNMCRAVLPAMIEAGSGVILNLSSGSGHAPTDGWSAYCASKAGLVMLTRSLDLEYGAHGIRVHDFIPGVVGTDLLSEAQEQFENRIAHIADHHKLTPDIPATCIAWLVDEGGGRGLGVHQSIRDPEFRALVGLEEREQW